MNLDDIMSNNKSNKPLLNYSMIIKTSMKEVYSNKELMQELLTAIEKNIFCLSINYNDTNFQIEIKIKKTSMKDIPNFSHTENFYYPILSRVYNDFISNHIDYIHSVIASTHPDVELYDLSRFTSTFLLFNITTIGDNIIYIHL